MRREKAAHEQGKEIQLYKKHHLVCFQVIKESIQQNYIGLFPFCNRISEGSKE